MKSAQHYTRQTYREQIKNIPLAVSAGFKPRKRDFEK